MSRFVVACLAFLNFGFCLVGPSGAAEERPFVLVTDFWPPFRIDNGNEPMTGIDVDLAGLLEKRLDVRIRIVRVPWARALKMMHDGNADLMAGLARIPEREQYILYVEPPYARSRAAFYALGAAPFKVARYDDLKGLAIGYTRDSAYFSRFDEDASLDKRAAADEVQLIRMLLGRRLDLIVGTDIQVDYDLKQRGLDSSIVKQAFQPEQATQLYIGISRRSPLTAREAEFGRALAELQADGSLHALYARYGLH
ncbi:MAG: transporter substrate-binding domain-containing protein [Propionivibrio sp.]